jgi:hypothetical protein
VLLVLPLFLFLPLTLVLPADNTALLVTEYVVWALAVFGVLMLYLKRTFVVVKKSSN